METRRQQSPTLPFKFTYANTLSLFAKKGLASTTAINLDGPEISYANILETATRDNRLVMALAPNTPLDPKTKKRLQQAAAQGNQAHR